MPDDIPSFADLLRKKSTLRRGAQKPLARKVEAFTPSLFDALHDSSPAETTPTVDHVQVVQHSSPTMPRPTPAAGHVFTVGELVSTLRSLVEDTYAQITVEGEISNWRPAASGHCYFSLKDGAAQLSVVLFRRHAQLLRFRPKDGDAVRLRGQLSIYDARGQLQLIAEFMQQTGLGALLAAVQELKTRLRLEGLFDNERPLPPFPRCIGVVTSLHGAALRDIIKVCRRRHAAVNLLIFSAAVQGPSCPAEIAAGVRWFTAHPERVDVVLVARGGGSWEDLHGFDAEVVVRAIAACPVPVITGIGHATDTVLADAAADLCAPTPSAAAELVTAAQHGLEERLQRLRARLEQANRYELLRTAQRLRSLSAELVLRRTHDSLGRRAQHLDDLAQRAEWAWQANLRRDTQKLSQLGFRLRHPALRLSEDGNRLSNLRYRLVVARKPAFNHAERRLLHAAAQLDALSPLRVLQRGYALVYGPAGELLRAAADAEPGTDITAHLAQGTLRARVLQ